MARKSSIKALPDGIVKQLNFMLEKERLTLDDLVDWLQAEKGYTISRSALGRYSKEYSEIRSKLAKTREISEAFARELGPENVSGKQGALIVEMMHTLLIGFMRDQFEEPGPLDGPLGDGEKEELTTKNLMELARALKDTSQANRFNQDFVEKMRAAIAAEDVPPTFGTSHTSAPVARSIA